ncbi:MAG: ribosome-binding factor A [Bdellovibrionales bacterium RIFCSPHIGHO2_01_FULL_40_29]|nr:MAG: ribosome-binding factor A [Bdellovibrionales bacterium RIFCSPHIGHO2_01_FULL_40_29]OFZ34564.1 MAG: ribosome-binding factor A [Bdellovibrionales bacterium RIFCSPHIGHO2_02_FULL_40_15]
MKNTGDGRRKERVEKEVQQIVSTYMINHLQSELGGLVTVTRVMMPADFRSAKVFVTFFSTENEVIDLVKVLQPWTKDIQNEINTKLKMRYCPKISFYKDESTENILKIEKIISGISAQKKPIEEN